MAWVYINPTNQSVVIMDLNENFIVTSKYGNGSKFSANFSGPIRVQDGHKMALKSIYYGHTFNVTTRSNLLLLIHKTKDRAPVYELLLKPGFYGDILSLTEEISRTINSWIDEEPVFCAVTGKKFEHTTVEFDVAKNIVHLNMKDHDHLFLTTDSRPNVLNLLHFWNYGPEEPFEMQGYEVSNGYLTNHFPAILYASVVENSYINGIPTRLLAVVPIASDDTFQGYQFHEFLAPTYYNFAIREFTDIEFYILDMDGQLLEFDPNFQTILTLEVFKPLNIM